MYDFLFTFFRSSVPEELRISLSDSLALFGLMAIPATKTLTRSADELFPNKYPWLVCAPKILRSMSTFTSLNEPRPSPDTPPEQLPSNEFHAAFLLPVKLFSPMVEFKSVTEFAVLPIEPTTPPEYEPSTTSPVIVEFLTSRAHPPFRSPIKPAEHSRAPR